MSAPAFTVRQEIRFGHCDPAKIIFYPRAMELLNQAIEDYFGSLGYPFSRMHGSLSMGSPTVDLHVAFKKVLRLGDPADFNIYVTHVGRTSLKLTTDVTVDGESYVTFQSVLVCTEAEEHSPQPWPDDLRQGLLAGLSQEERKAS
ncbi:MAG: thioesterase family protein [Pseudomonadota bacterium]